MRLEQSFARFSEDLNEIAKSEGQEAAASWQSTFRNGKLTKLINETFFEIGRTHSCILNRDRERNTTIQPSLYEIFREN